MLPRLYAIIDAGFFPDEGALLGFARELRAAGVTLLQYRNKSGSSRQLLSQARELRRNLRGAQLIMNDRADLCVAAGFDGIHVGQDDLPAEDARKLVGSKRWLGVSTHVTEQVRQAAETSADYIAVGPVFPTATKANPDPVIGLAGVKRARELTSKPLVAIGGITRENCRSVVEAGADAVAVISDLLGSPGKSAEEFLRRLR
jgi:thiamine-phosphate pyrophosphorylase